MLSGNLLPARIGERASSPVTAVQVPGFMGLKLFGFSEHAGRGMTAECGKQKAGPAISLPIVRSAFSLDLLYPGAVACLEGDPLGVYTHHGCV